MSRAYLNSVRRPRITLRTVARDTESALTISLIERPCSKLARRISPILSAPNIPIRPSQPTRPKGRTLTHRSEGVVIGRENSPSGGHYCKRFCNQSRGNRVEHLAQD